MTASRRFPFPLRDRPRRGPSGNLPRCRRVPGPAASRARPAAGRARLRDRHHRGGLRPVVGRRSRAGRHQRRVGAGGAGAPGRAARVRRRLRLQLPGGPDLRGGGDLPARGGREHALRSRAGQHDRCQPGARRRRVAARGGRRHARRPALAAPWRRRQRDDPPGLRPDAAGALGGGRVPGHRHAVLADAAAAAHAHALRRRGPGRDLLRLRVAAVEGARRGTGPAGHVGVGRRHGEDAPPGHVQPAVPRRRTGHPGVRGALRGGAGADRRGPRRRPVHPRPVGGTAGQRGARADRRVPVRLAAQGGRLPRRPCCRAR